MKEVEAFETAAADYRGKNFHKAKDVLETLYRKNPIRLYAIYLHRINHYLQFPPPADWDGVEQRLHLPEDLTISQPEMPALQSLKSS
jgi:adenylate cyclase